jgi:proteic killer suppression protein
MITSFRHRGLKRLYEDDDRSLVPAEYTPRLRIILAALDAAETVKDMDLHIFKLHALKGDLQGFWSITVRANWRVIFRFENGNAFDIALVDYH